MAKGVTYVCVPGLWLRPESYEPTFKLLVSEQDHALVSYASLPSNEDLSGEKRLEGPAAAEADVAEARNVILKALEATDVVLVGHSYGGAVGGNAVEGLSAAARLKEGKSTAVVAIAYVASFLLPNGAVLGELAGAGPPQWIMSENEILTLDKPEYYLYHDVKPDEQAKWIKATYPHNYAAHKYLKITCEAFKEIPCSYLITTEDRALPLAIQEQSIEMAGPDAKFIFTERIDSSHCPFISRPEETAAFLRRTLEAARQAGGK
ncbi:MAG: hypothetical protein CYPHOPRED_002103 [Cyphobasidiales sp. Tagirdzhanova-0007]|nr:MAG: hypothetical protein CYPHOPRED_002103 [Cyphobasidiales sp. Tagirdzhanova-0007]